MVLIDQDGSGPGGSNQMAMMVLLQSPQVKVLWDELAAAAWLDPKIITKERMLYVDVDTTRGPTYGDTLTWTAEYKPTVSGPQGEMQPVHVQDDLDSTKFDKMFVDLMKAQPVVP